MLAAKLIGRRAFDFDFSHCLVRAAATNWDETEQTHYHQFADESALLNGTSSGVVA
jgi:hypothetical protein